MTFISCMPEVPLIEPVDFQEVKDMTKWGFEFSEVPGTPVLPVLVNAVYHKPDTILVVPDNSGTAMMGFLPYPGLVWDSAEGVSRFDEAICVGCGVRAHVCPVGAIEKMEVA